MCWLNQAERKSIRCHWSQTRKRKREGKAIEANIWHRKKEDRRQNVKQKGSERSIKIESDHGEEESQVNTDNTCETWDNLLLSTHCSTSSFCLASSLPFFQWKQVWARFFGISSGKRWAIILTSNGEKYTIQDSVRKASAAGLWPTPQVLWAITDNYLQSRCF